MSFTFGSIRPWNTCGDHHTFMSLYPPNPRREREDYYVLLLDRDRIRARIELHADSHEEAKVKAMEEAKAFLRAAREECDVITSDLEESDESS